MTDTLRFQPEVSEEALQRQTDHAKHLTKPAVDCIIMP